jgi:tRNA-dihydrouridine synthase
MRLKLNGTQQLLLCDGGDDDDDDEDSVMLLGVDIDATKETADTLIDANKMAVAEVNAGCRVKSWH